MPPLKEKDSGTNKKAALALARTKLRPARASDPAKWADLTPHTDQDLWNEARDIRRATTAGLMREAERNTPGAPLDYKLVFDHPRQNDFGGGPRAFSSSEGLVNMPDDPRGYMSNPQYLAAILAHEVAHNADWRRNKPKVGHNKETFRPLERAASRSAALEPFYNEGDDVGLGGVNEYPDEYRGLGKYTPQYFMSANEMDPTQQVFPVDAKRLAYEIINRRNITRGGPIRGGGQVNIPGQPRGFQI